MIDIFNFFLPVLCYLALFRLEELGVGYFRKMVASQDVNKMFKFCNFLLNEENIKTWMTDEVIIINALVNDYGVCWGGGGGGEG